MENINPKEALKRKNYSTALSDDSPRKLRWRVKVLADNYQTTKQIDQTISDVKTSRKNVEKSLEATREVLDKYEGFKKNFNKAITKLSQRIELEENNKLKPVDTEVQEEFGESTASVSDDSSNMVSFKQSCPVL
mmetsp:Transcript_38167/g.37670  ORF Transcript_38167/g.37670 Transcript_38167/m.37670 type:complete len:134 (+) Transcript_38167:34-435(+)